MGCSGSTPVKEIKDTSRPKDALKKSDGNKNKKANKVKPAESEKARAAAAKAAAAEAEEKKRAREARRKELEHVENNFEKRRQERERQKTPEPPKEVELAGPRGALTGHTQNVDLCAWSPARDVLLTAGTDRKVFLWNFERGNSYSEPEWQELELPLQDGASCASWSRDGRHIAIGKLTHQTIY